MNTPTPKGGRFTDRSQYRLWSRRLPVGLKASRVFRSHQHRQRKRTAIRVSVSTPVEHAPNFACARVVHPACAVHTVACERKRRLTSGTPASARDVLAEHSPFTDRCGCRADGLSLNGLSAAGRPTEGREHNHNCGANELIFHPDSSTKLIVMRGPTKGAGPLLTTFRGIEAPPIRSGSGSYPRPFVKLLYSTGNPAQRGPRNSLAGGLWLRRPRRATFALHTTSLSINCR